MQRVGGQSTTRDICKIQRQNLCVRSGFTTECKAKDEPMCRAYKEWVDEHGAEQSLPSLPDLSAEQLFFLNFAQVLLHIDRCPTKLHFALI